MLDSKKGVVIALGYFDCLHVGHLTVVDKAKELAKQLNAEPVVFTFDGDLRSFVKGQKEGSVYTLQERKLILKNLGVNETYCAPVDTEFLSLSAKEFLDILNKEYKILAYCCGQDYRFGANGQGDVEFLQNYAKLNNQTTCVLPPFQIDGQKVSTSLIKGLLADGKLKKANHLLGRNYFLSGVVFGDRKVGSKIGFPTANLLIEDSKFPLKNGVYSGIVNLDGANYKTVINYGARPTFDLNNKLIEAHIIGFNGDLYGKTITLQFTDYLRDIQKFSSVNELKNQLELDVEKVKSND